LNAAKIARTFENRSPRIGRWALDKIRIPPRLDNPIFTATFTALFSPQQADARALARVDDHPATVV